MDNTKVADMRKLACGFVTAWEHSISDVDTIIDNTNRIIEDFSTEKNTIFSELKNALAQSKSFRKKDFDSMVKDIFLRQDDTGKEVKNLVRAYLSEQKVIAGEIKKSLSEGESLDVSSFLEMLGDILKRLSQIEDETKKMLRGYRNEQEEMAKTLRGFLDKGEKVRVRDFKSLINKIQLRQKERKEEVRRMLDGFRAKRKTVHEGGDMERFTAEDNIAENLV